MQGQACLHDQQSWVQVSNWRSSLTVDTSMGIVLPLLSERQLLLVLARCLLLLLSHVNIPM